MAWLPKRVKKIIIVIGLALLGLLCIPFIYIAGVTNFYATYTSFCNLNGSSWALGTMDITDNTYRLGGIENIGIGSTRQEIVNAVERRNTRIEIFYTNRPLSRYIFLSEPHALPDSTLGFYRVRTWNAIEFLFDENDEVTKIRITPMF